jgi:dipeptidyl aminopeptidase/acylaminoacyl peptidase
MKTIFLFFLPLTFLFAQVEKKEIGNLVIEGVPEIPAALKEKMNQYQNTRSASFVDWAPDGKSMLMSTRFGDVAQLHIISQPGGARKQITFFKEPLSNGTFCPKETTQKFIYSKDVGGNEFTQLYLYDLFTGKYDMISDGGRTQNSLPNWSNDGKQFITVSTRRNLKDYDLYLCDIANPKEAKLVLKEGGSWSAGDWSPDNQSVLVSKYVSITNSFLYLLNLKTGALEQINKSDKDIAYGGAVWSADGKGFFVVNDEGSEFRTLKYYDLASKQFTSITSAIPWDVTELVISSDRKSIVFATNEDGISKLYRLDGKSKKYTAISGLPTGVISGIKFSPNHVDFAMTINTPQTPGDIHTYSLKSKKLTRWTYSEVGGLNSEAFTIPSLIHFETFDKINEKPRQIPAFYYKPNKTGKTPVLIMIHGGPEAQFLPNFNSFISYLNNELGIAVIAPNVRGSSGYGKTYLKLDNVTEREASVMDIGSLLDWIGNQPDLDASRVCVYGGSYGGYMVLSSMFHFNDRLKCGIDVVGISNFVTFLKNTEDYRKDLRRVEYGDERDPRINAFLEHISPSNNVEKIKKPLYIIQGLNDPRVPVTEAEQMRDKVRAKNGECWYLMAKDEGHGFKKKANVDFMQWSVVTFLMEKLMK